MTPVGHAVLVVGVVRYLLGAVHERIEAGMNDARVSIPGKGSVHETILWDV